MRLYRHRINTLADLERLPADVGLEFDLRSSGDRVIVTHDPFTEGPTIEEFFPNIGARPCIFNVKCEGIEQRVSDLAKECGIEDWFMLDLSVPAAVKLARRGETRMAVRYSEMEPAAGVLAWKGRAAWVWVDCFEAFPTEPEAWRAISDAFKICLVSPELQGHTGDAWQRIHDSVQDLRFDAVCTKTPERWVKA